MRALAGFVVGAALVAGVVLLGQRFLRNADSNLYFRLAYLVPDQDGDGLAEVLHLDDPPDALLVPSGGGEPRKVPWSWAEALVRPRLGDVDGDGEPEVVRSRYASDPDGESGWTFEVRSGATREVLWTVDCRGWSLPLLVGHDLDGDGVRDGLLVEWRGSRLAARSGRTGDPLFDVSLPGTTATGSPVVLERDPASGRASILVVATTGTRPSQATLFACSPRDGSVQWSAPLPVGYSDLVPLADQDADGVPDVLAGAMFELGAVVCSGVDGSVLRTIPRAGLVPHPELVASYDRGADLDGDGVDDFVVNLGSYGDPPERDCSYVYSGRDLTLLRKLR